MMNKMMTSVRALGVLGNQVTPNKTECPSSSCSITLILPESIWIKGEKHAVTPDLVIEALSNNDYHYRPYFKSTDIKVSFVKLSK